MEAKKLPSGSWRCRVYSHTENGKQIYKSFICKDPSKKGKRICEAEAAAWAKDKENAQRSVCLMTFKEAAKDFLAVRENILSPTTIEAYNSFLRSSMGRLGDKQINHITQRDIQDRINEHAKKHSPKTCKNLHGFISVVMSEYRPDFVLRTKLPKSKAVEYYIPSDKEVKKLIDAAEGTSLLVPILLAAFGPMRRGEICALSSEDISGNTAHVHRNCVRKVVDGKNTWIMKQPKSKAGDRYITFPDFVAEHFKDKEGLICPICPDTITKAFEILLEKNNLPHFRFHDLRHYSASIQHALGVPDKYIMSRSGWSNDRILKQVYSHVMDDQAAKNAQKVNDYFTNHVTNHVTK